MQIFLMRHGQDLNPDLERLTDADLSLSELGKDQATNCAAKIKDALGSSTAPVIIASPRLRTMQTASIVSTRLGLDPANVIYDVRLKERDCAVYSGQLVTKVFSRTETDLVAGGMEPYSMFQNRLKAFYDELLLQVVAPTIVVTHSGNVEPLMEIANVDKEYTLEANNFIRLA